MKGEENEIKMERVEWWPKGEVGWSAAKKCIKLKQPLCMRIQLIFCLSVGFSIEN